MPFANNGEVQLYWRQDGSDNKPPLLLLHPILTDHSVWDRVVPLLTDHFEDMGRHRQQVTSSRSRILPPTPGRFSAPHR